MVRKTGAENRHQKMESIYGAQFMALIAGACVMGVNFQRLWLLDS